MNNIKAWVARKHVRSCERPPGTNGPDDAGCKTACNCDTWLAASLGDLRALAARAHAGGGHPGPADSCQSPHDVLCKAVWP